MSKDDPKAVADNPSSDRKQATLHAKQKRRKEISPDREIRWARLDNTANLFPAIAGESMTNVYRISVTLNEYIDEALLQRALDMVLPRMDSFNVRLRKGLFWYYFEENGKPAPRVEKEHTFPCRYIRPNRNHSYLFRVTYYERRVNLEVFHVLTDGMGGLNFLRELTYQYLRLAHKELDVGDFLDPETSLNVEDSFVRNYRHSMPHGFEVRKAYLLKGKKLPHGVLGLMHAYIPQDQLKNALKTYNVSANTYLVSCFAYAVYTACLHGGPSDRPIRIAVPVNLRPYYDSVTTRNFFIMISAEFAPDDHRYEFSEVASIIDQSLKAQMSKEHLEDLFSYSVSNQENIWLRMIPLPIKGLAMRIVYNQSALAHTSTVTNIGKISIDDMYEPYIERFHAFITMSKAQYLKGTICAFKNEYVFTFSTLFTDTSVEKAFCKQLVSDGIEVKLETNGVF